MRSALVPWFATLGPLALSSAALFSAFANARSASSVATASLAASLVAVAVAIATFAFVVVHGTLHTAVLGFDGIGFQVYLDRLSATMLCLVSFIGLTVVAYSRHYLEGDRGQVRFIRLLCLTLAAVLAAIVSGNFFGFAIAWIATSFYLRELLVFNPDRPAAIMAARKEWLASRLGDLCLLVAVVLIYQRFGSLDYAVVFAGADALRAASSIPSSTNVIAILLVGTALLKSAQFPFHGWLTEVMEAPTPVSALLHAGIVNAGGYLILRFSHLIAPSAPSLEILVLVGGITALYGSVVMLAQTSVKSSLAHSTIAQMGFMMLECGLGAFPTALLHIVAHSLYKAHAFLASGSVIDLVRASWVPTAGKKQPRPLVLAFAIAAVLSIAVGVGGAFGFTLAQRPGALVLGATLVLGLIHLVVEAIDGEPSGYVVGRIAAVASFVAIVYFSLQFAAERFCAGFLPTPALANDPFAIAEGVVVVAAFTSVTLLQRLMAFEAARPRWRAAYVHVANGFYVNTFVNRILSRPRRKAARRSITTTERTGWAGR